MDWPTALQSLAGGALIGLAASVLLLVNGRVAGVSGIAGSVAAAALGRIDGSLVERAAFVVGLPAGVVLFYFVFRAWPEARFDATLPILVIGGLLVGVGTRLGSGCTSGHGVCGLARLSPRSLAATLTFFAVAALTVFVMEHIL
jgi:uncharacterized membrane protein YedE/YeeE